MVHQQGSVSVGILGNYSWLLEGVLRQTGDVHYHIRNFDTSQNIVHKLPTAKTRAFYAEKDMVRRISIGTVLAAKVALKEATDFDAMFAIDHANLPDQYQKVVRECGYAGALVLRGKGNRFRVFTTLMRLENVADLNFGHRAHSNLIEAILYSVIEQAKLSAPAAQKFFKKAA